MKKYISLFVAFLATFITANAFAFTAPPAPAHGWYVVDQTGRMSTVEISALNQKIDRVSKATHNEFGVALIQSLDGDTIDDAAYNTFKAWGIGKHGLDNGVLIMVALKDHKTRIETGKGVGGEITDLQAKQILDNTMRPRLKAGNFAGAFSAAIDDLSSLMDSRANQKATPVPVPTVNTQQSDAPVNAAPVAHQSDGSTELFVLMVFLVLGVVGFFVWWFISRSRNNDDDDYEYRTYTPPSTVHTGLPSATRSMPLTPSAPYVAPYAAPVSYGDDYAASVLATAAIVESEREERREERREEPREESSYVAPDPEPYSAPAPDPTPDFGGGFGGGDSGGGGANSDF